VMAQQFFEHLQRHAGIEKVGGKRVALMSLATLSP